MPGLLDYFGGAGGSNFMDAISNNRNSLIGLGMGMLAPSYPARGESPWSNALQGFQGGAGLDAQNMRARQQLAQHQADRAQAQANADRTYKLQERQFEEANWAPGTYKDPNTEQEFPYQQNKRTGDIRWLMGKPPSMGGQMAGGAVGYGQAGVGPGGFGTGGATTEPSATVTQPAFAPGAQPSSQYQAPPGMLPSQAKAYREEMAKQAAKRAVGEQERKAGEQRTADVVTQDIDRAINTIEANPNTATGLMGSVYGKVSPGSPAGTLAGLLTTIKANTSFDKLQQMRQASPTGGSLGQVSDKENNLLQAAIGDLEQSRNPEELKYNLDRVRRTYQEIIHGPGKGGEPRYSPPSTQSKGQGAFSPKGGRTGGASLPSGKTKTGITWTAE